MTQEYKNLILAALFKEKWEMFINTQTQQIPQILAYMIWEGAIMYVILEFEIYQNF